MAAAFADGVTQKRSVLIIDSEPVVREVLERILTDVGYKVQATGDFDAALRTVRESEPDLVITNVFLRGIRGHDAMRRLRAEFPNVQVLMVSGLPDDEAIRDWVGEVGFDAFPKPFTAAALKRKVRECIGEADEAPSVNSRGDSELRD